MTQRTMKKNLDEYAELSRQIAALEARKKAVAERIQQGMGNAEEMQIGPYTARWRPVTSSRFDAAAFKAIHAELYTAFCRLQTVKRFTVATE